MSDAPDASDPNKKRPLSEAELATQDEATLNNKRKFEAFTQVKGSKEDIDTRIKVFIEHKNEQVNTTNNQEFLKVPEPQPGVSARTNTLPIERGQQIRIYEVENEEGPSVNVDTVTTGNKKRHDTINTIEVSNDEHVVRFVDKLPEELPAHIEERLSNLEDHLYTNLSVRVVPKDIYARIKKLEDRVLYLEKKGKTLPLNKNVP